MQKLANRLGLRADPTIFFVSAGLSLIFVLLLVAAPGPIGSAFVTGSAWIVTNLGWFFILGVNVWLGFLIYAAMSRYGHIRPGPRGSRPDYSNLSWFTMLFAGGIGTVLMFWSALTVVATLSIVAGLDNGVRLLFFFEPHRRPATLSPNQCAQGGPR